MRPGALPPRSRWGWGTRGTGLRYNIKEAMRLRSSPAVSFPAPGKRPL